MNKIPTFQELMTSTHTDFKQSYPNSGTRHCGPLVEPKHFLLTKNFRQAASCVVRGGSDDAPTYRWDYGTREDLYQLVKKIKCRWEYGHWCARPSDVPIIEAAVIRKRNWCLVHDTDPPFQGLVVQIEIFASNSADAAVVSVDLGDTDDPRVARSVDQFLRQCRWLKRSSGLRIFGELEEKDGGLCRLVSAPLNEETLNVFLTFLGEGGASVKTTILPNLLVDAWRAEPIKIERRLCDLLIVAKANLCNPVHRLLAPAAIPNNRPWHGESFFPSTDWKLLRQRAAEHGLHLEEIRPIENNTSFDFSELPGWAGPANSKDTLYKHQREGVQFVCDHNHRAIVADEMGTGKTGIAIVSALAAGAARVLVVCPAIARDEWEKQIVGWSRAQADSPVVVQLDDRLNDDALPASGWVIVSYDMLVDRAVTLVFDIKSPAVNKLRGALYKSRANFTERPNFVKSKIWFTVRHDQRLGPVLKQLKVTEPGAHTQIQNAARRLTVSVQKDLLGWDPSYIIVDEAHRIKNPDAIRTRQVRALAQIAARGVLLLTGTPLRNHAGEGAELLDALFPGAVAELTAAFKCSTERCVAMAARDEAVRQMFSKFMIRRPKSEVLPNLPPKIRQRLNFRLGPAAEPLLEGYSEAMVAAQQAFSSVLQTGGSLADARARALPHWSTARRLLGLAKVVDGQMIDYIQDTVIQKGAALVFAYHLDVIRLLQKRLSERGISVVSLTGESSRTERTKAQNDFKNGQAQVFIGSIGAAGEAITLTRADTVIFIEFSWVPGEMFQAENRGHRPGQTASSYHIIHIATSHEMDRLMIDALEEKLSIINPIMGEGVELFAKEALARPIPSDGDPLSELAKKRHTEIYGAIPNRMKRSRSGSSAKQQRDA